MDKNFDEDVCPECEEKLPWTKTKCKSKGEFFSECLSPLYYDGKAGEALRRFKFMGKTSYARRMGRLIADCVRENGKGGYDAVTWVPISARRMRKRGYCQAKLLAKEVAKALDIKCVRLLRKRRHTPPQSTLSGLAARKANISGAFCAVNKSGIAGASILLIDDVVTTGATLSECTRMLLMSGARNVSCATLCKSTKK
ncbi:MAG: ComF family protein [Oscillospiraceae bacterium]|nr:ComF family protein [Oscillospiraceae bacterium]